MRFATNTDLELWTEEVEQGVIDNMIIFQKPFPGAARSVALEESPSRVGRLGAPSRRSAGQAYAEQTFFSPAQSTVPASRFPSSSERAPCP